MDRPQPQAGGHRHRTVSAQQSSPAPKPSIDISTQEWALTRKRKRSQTIASPVEIKLAGFTPNPRSQISNECVSSVSVTSEYRQRSRGARGPVQNSKLDGNSSSSSGGCDWDLKLPDVRQHNNMSLFEELVSRYPLTDYTLSGGSAARDEIDEIHNDVSTPSKLSIDTHITEETYSIASTKTSRTQFKSANVSHYGGSEASSSDRSTESEEELDQIRIQAKQPLFWVPASQHPEIAPQEYQKYLERFNHLHNKVHEKSHLVPSPTGSDTSATNETTTSEKKRGNLQRRAKVKPRRKSGGKSPSPKSPRDMTMTPLTRDLSPVENRVEKQSGMSSSVQAKLNVLRHAVLGNRSQETEAKMPITPINTSIGTSSSEFETKSSVRPTKNRPSFQDITKEVLALVSPLSPTSTPKKSNTKGHKQRKSFFGLLGLAKAFGSSSIEDMTFRDYPAAQTPEHMMRHISRASTQKLSTPGRSLQQQVLITNLIFQVMAVEERSSAEIEAMKKRAAKTRALPKSSSGSRMKRSIGTEPALGPSMNPKQARRMRKSMRSGKREKDPQYDPAVMLLRMHLGATSSEDEDDGVVERRRPRSTRAGDSSSSGEDADQSSDDGIEEDDEKPLALILKAQ